MVLRTTSCQMAHYFLLPRKCVALMLHYFYFLAEVVLPATDWKRNGRLHLPSRPVLCHPRRCTSTMGPKRKAGAGAAAAPPPPPLVGFRPQAKHITWNNRNLVVKGSDLQLGGALALRQYWFQVVGGTSSDVAITMIKIRYLRRYLVDGSWVSELYPESDMESYELSESVLASPFSFAPQANKLVSNPPLPPASPSRLSLTPQPRSDCRSNGLPPTSVRRLRCVRVRAQHRRCRCRPRPRCCCRRRCRPRPVRSPRGAAVSG